MKKKFKQGQTIYFVEYFAYMGASKPAEVYKRFLHSRKIDLPEEGCIIEKLPAHFVNEKIKNGTAPKTYTSRRKAESEAKKYNIEHGFA